MHAIYFENKYTGHVCSQDVTNEEVCSVVQVTSLDVMTAMLQPYGINITQRSEIGFSRSITSLIHSFH